ncbi:MAG: endo-1,4-beta-xylanase [Ignavibacteriae bacterium]|nr:endo-1,4-beta-xylanase [Ignavibacteriota bacterium]
MKDHLRVNYNCLCNFYLLLLISTLISFSSINSQPIAEGQNKFLGCAYSYFQATNFEKYWNQVTPENGGKWGSVEGIRDQMNWGEAATAYNFAKSKGFKFRYHILVWGNQQPGWIEALDSQEQLEEIEEWFAAVAAQFPDLDYLEVVNEPLHDPPGEGNGGYIGALGGSDSLYGTGWDWIIKAFELARQYFPDSTKLYINEYNIVNSSTNTAKYLEIINLLIERDLIDGIGVQAHAFSTKSASESTIEENLNALAETGLPIQICEMDIDGIEDEIQLEEYKRVFPIFWQHNSVEGITLWGWRHGLWRESQGAYLVDDRGAPRPALEWIRNYVENPPPPIPNIVSPKNESNVPRNPLLIWNQTRSSTSYHLQISANSIFTAIVKDTVITDTTLQIETPLGSNFRYYWRISSMNEFNESSFSPFSYFITSNEITDKYELQITTDEFQLYQNYPNPFNPTTTISFYLPENGKVSITLYDELGRLIKQITENYFFRGNHFIKFDASNVASGLYFYQLKYNNICISKKLVILK